MIHWMTALLLLGGVVGFTGCSSVPELESPIVCEGNFHYHLQDVCVNDKGELFWTFTDTLAKTDSRGNLIATCSTEEEYAHLGGIVAKDGKLYVAVGFVRDWSIGSEKAEIFVYDEDTLELIERYPINETKSIDGITTTPNGFFVAGDRIDKGPNVEIFEFSPEFELLGKHILDTGVTDYGIQNTKNYGDGYLVSLYGSKLFELDKDFNFVAEYRADIPYGFIVLDSDRLLVATLFDIIQWEQYRARLDEVSKSNFAKVR